MAVRWLFTNKSYLPVERAAPQSEVVVGRGLGEKGVVTVCCVAVGWLEWVVLVVVVVVGWLVCVVFAVGWRLVAVCSVFLLFWGVGRVLAGGRFGSGWLVIDVRGWCW